jgi:hypothetical protein
MGQDLAFIHCLSDYTVAGGQLLRPDVGLQDLTLPIGVGPWSLPTRFLQRRPDRGVRGEDAAGQSSARDTPPDFSPWLKI